MGGDYYSMLMSNAGKLQNVMSNAVANQAAYSAPAAQTVTNTFTPANIQQTNDMGTAATNWARKQLEDEIAREKANGVTDPGILTKTFLGKGYSIDDLYGLI